MSTPTVQNVELVAVAQPITVVQVDAMEEEEQEERQQGIRWGFWVLVAVMLVGYCIVWAGMCFFAGNKQSPGTPLFFIGLGVAALGSLVLCFVIQMGDKPSCIKATGVFVCLGVMALIPYLIILYSTDHVSKNDDLGEEREWLNTWGATADVAIKVIMTVQGLAAVGLTVAVGGCFLCRMSCLQPKEEDEEGDSHPNAPDTVKEVSEGGPAIV